MAEDPISLNKQSPSSTVKRQPRSLASKERQRQFAKDFGPELILTTPGLSGPISIANNNAKREDD